MAALGVVLGLAAPAGPAAAALLAEDGFDDYPSGSIDGADAGSGFGAPWSGQGLPVEAVVDVSDDALNYTTSGGERIVGGIRALSLAGNHDQAAARLMPTTIDASDVYVSMLVRFTGTQNDNDFLGFWFHTSTFGGAPNLGIKMNDGTGASVNDFFARTQSSNHVTRVDLVPGRTYLLVGHMSKPAGNPSAAYNRFRFWVDPITLSAQPPEDGVSVGGSGINGFAGIGFRAVNLDAGDVVTIDRLRIGTTWADVTAPDRVPVLALDMDESSWRGAAGEVADSALGLNGTAAGGADTAASTPAIPGSPGTCRYGDFDGSDDHVLVPHHAALNGDDALTYMAWVRPRNWSGIRQIMAKSVHGGGAGRAQMGLFSEGGVLKLRAETAAGRREVSSALPVTNNWVHVAGVFDGTRLTLYLDGTEAASRTFAATTLVANGDPLAVGKRVGSSQYFFDGAIDEVRVYRVALNGAEIGVARTATRPCGAQPFGTANGFRISHDGAGIHCLDEPVAVAALDAVGDVLEDYLGTIELTTDSGRGSWSVLEGAGILVDGSADDGAATYQFHAADAGTVRLALAYPEGPAVNVAAWQSGAPEVRDTDVEGPIAFAPSGFTVTGTALPNPPPSPLALPVQPQLAGADFLLHLTAYGVTDDDPLCGVIESYTGTRQLRFGHTHVNPDSGSLLTEVEGAAAGNSLGIEFDAGQAQVSVRYHDVGAIRLAVEDGASFDHPLRGASNDFVVRPGRLAITRVASAAGVANPGTVTATGPAFVAAGAAFEVDVEAQTVNGVPTPNFGREDPPESVRVSSAELLAPLGGRNGAAGDVSGGAAFSDSGVPGRLSNEVVSFDEVGSIRLTAEIADGDYLGSGPAAAVADATVGRFRPASYQVLSAALTPGCGTFTYMDQPALGVSYVLQALNAAGVVTENYDAGLLGAGNVAAVSLAAESADDGVDLGSRLAVAASDWVAGEVVVDDAAAWFARAPTPDGPFAALDVALRLVDGVDGQVVGAADRNAATSGDCVLAGDCDARTLGQTGVFYGRLVVLPASGPESEPLRVPLVAQAFDGAAFVAHDADQCTPYTAGAVSLDDFSGNLDPGETSVLALLGAPALTDGRDDDGDPIRLAAPGIGNDGSTRVRVDVPGYLEFDWQGSGAEDPSASAAFGRYRGHDRIIYRRETP